MTHFGRGQGSPCGRAASGQSRTLGVSIPSWVRAGGQGPAPAEGGAGSLCPAKRTNYSSTVHPCLQSRVILATMTATSPGPRELYKSEQNKSPLLGAGHVHCLSKGGTFLYRSAFSRDCHSDSREIKQNNPLNLPFSSISPWVEQTHHRQTTGQGHNSHLLLCSLVV